MCWILGKPVSRHKDDDPFNWRPVVPADLLEHLRHFMGTIKTDLRGSAGGFTIRASDDVRTLARRMEQLAQELERKRRATEALRNLLTQYARSEDEEEDG